MNGIAQWLVTVLILSVELALMIWGWVRWWKNPQRRTMRSILSLVGLAFATASILLWISAALYARSIGGFPYFDPRVFRVFRWGGLLSVGAIVFAIGGVWRPNALRWHALVCAAGALFLWFATAAGE
jgi:hypothetical protein